jgi:hypothetical protein
MPVSLKCKKCGWKTPVQKGKKKGKHFSMYSHFYMFLLLSQGKGCKIK